MKQKHIVIAGTGRSGTTLLVKLFTELGLDTGFSAADLTAKVDPISYGGLERNLESIGKGVLPRVLKSPFFYDYADMVLKNPDVQIEHIIIPIRRLEDAAKSRIRIEEIFLSQSERNNGGSFPGGLTGTNTKQDQEIVLGRQLVSLIMKIAKSGTPHTFLNFPDFALDADYLYKSVKFLIPNVTYEVFCETHLRVIDLEKIHHFK